MRSIMVLLAGFILGTVGTAVAFAFGFPLVLDLFFDSYPDTLLDHPVEATGLVGGVLVAAAGVLVMRHGLRAAPSRFPIPRGMSQRVAAGAAGAVAVAFVAFLALGFTGLCGFGCSTSAYLLILSGLGAVAAVGLLLVAAAASPAAGRPRPPG